MTPNDDRRDTNPPELLGALWRRLWLVALVAVVCGAAAFFVANSEVRKYEGTARLLYQPPTDVSDPMASGSNIDPDTMSVQLESVSSTIESPAVRSQVKTLLDGTGALPEHEVTATPVEPQDPSTNAVFRSSIDISVVSGSPQSAARLANAYAAAVIALRQKETRERYAAAQQVIKDQLELYKTPESQVTADYAILTQQLHNLEVAEATATGDFKVIVPATPPTSPISPQPLKSAALGLAIGLIAGVAVAYAIARLDTRVRTSREVAEIVGIPTIGRVPRIPRSSLRAGDLVTVTQPGGQISEALRMIRSNLEWAAIDGELKSLLVTSSVKGEGKSLTISNLAVTLARAGNRVVLVDGDLRAPRLHAIYGMSNVVGLTSVALGRSDLDDALQVFPLAADGTRGAPGAMVRLRPGQEDQFVAGDEGSLHVLTSGPLPPDPGEVIASRRVAAVFQQLQLRDYDYVLVDAPPILVVGDAAALAPTVDGLVLLASMEKVRRPMLNNARDLLASFPCRKVGVVVTGERVEHSDYYSYDRGRSQVASAASPRARGKRVNDRTPTAG